jgi:hypothetical protein
LLSHRCVLSVSKGPWWLKSWSTGRHFWGVVEFLTCGSWQEVLRSLGVCPRRDCRTPASLSDSLFWVESCSTQVLLPRCAAICCLGQRPEQWDSGLWTSRKNVSKINFSLYYISCLRYLVTVMKSWLISTTLTSCSHLFW